MAVRKETALGVVGALAIGAGGFFGLLSPQSAATADLREQIGAVHASNDQVRAELPSLKAQLATISGQVENLRGLSAQVPAELDMPGLLQELGAAAAAAGITTGVENVNVSVPTLVEAQAAPAADPAQAASASDPAAQPDANQAAAADGTAASAGSSPIAKFTVTMSVKGAMPQVVAFLGALKDAGRLAVVTTSSVAVAGEDGLATMQINATYYLQKVDVDNMVEQIEALRDSTGQPSDGRRSDPDSSSVLDPSVGVEPGVGDVVDPQVPPLPGSVPAP